MAIVLVPDGRILAVKREHKSTQPSVHSAWTCSLTTACRGEAVPEVTDALVADSLKKRLGMDIDKVQGHIGNRKVFSPYGQRGKQFIVRTYQVTSVLPLKLEAGYIVRAFSYGRILDMLEDPKQRFKFDSDTESVFKMLWETNWRRGKL
jgi:hypothetical protein